MKDEDAWKLEEASWMGNHGHCYMRTLVEAWMRTQGRGSLDEEWKVKTVRKNNG